MIFKKLKWYLMSNDNKLLHLKKAGLIIGKDCEILNGYDFGSEPYLVEIGDHVRIAGGVRITTHDGGIWVVRGLDENNKDADRFGKVKIGNNCHIGLNAIIMPGVTIGENCIIGAGAVVTKDVPANSVAAGVPAKVMETIKEYISKNQDSFTHTKDMGYIQKRDFLMSGEYVWN